MYRLQIRQVASALVHRGYDPRAIRSLNDLVAVDAVNEWARFFRGRQTGQSPVRAYYLIMRFRSIARHWLNADRGHIDRITKIGRHFLPNRRGLRERDRTRLRQFDDPANLRALFELPERLAQEATRRCAEGRNWTKPIMTAVAIELLLLGPIPIGVLRKLKLGRNVKIDPRSTTIRIVIPAQERARYMDLAFTLPSASAKLLRLYIRRFRSQLTDDAQGWLFPSKGDTPMTEQWYTWAIRDTPRKSVGLCVNPHLLRQLSVKLFLTRNPNGLEIVRQVMGYKTTRAVSRAYQEFLLPREARRFDGKVLKAPRL